MQTIIFTKPTADGADCEFSQYHATGNTIIRIHPRTGVQAFEYKSAEQVRFQLDTALLKSHVVGWRPIYQGPALFG